MDSEKNIKLVRELVENELYHWDDSIQSLLIEEDDKNINVSFELWGKVREIIFKIKDNSVFIKWNPDNWELTEYWDYTIRYFWMALLIESES